MKLFKSTIQKALFIIVLFAFIPVLTHSASLSINPTNVTVATGNIFSLNILVNTEGKVINNVEGEIQFPKDYLEVVSIDKSSSIFSLWVVDPSFSNNEGKVFWNGGVPNPGYQGSSGKIVTVVFRAKKTGTASLVFTNSAVRENDGLGTDILNARIGSNISITGITQTEQPPTPTQTVTSTSKPIITSSTHPNPNDWYNNNDVEFEWKIPTNATAVKTLLGKFPDSDTSVLYNTPIKNRKIEDLQDGVWYFHINYRNQSGWSEVAHYKLQIDTESPTDMNINTSIDEFGRVTVNVQASDSLSGIDYYTVKVNSETPFMISTDDKGIGSSNIPISSIGENQITVRAYDKAGNLVEKTVSITTNKVSSISIDSYAEKIKVGENIEISGTAPYAGSKILVSIKRDSTIIESITLTADSYSKFNFKSQILREPGLYSIWAGVVLPDNKIGATSQTINVNVIKPIMLQIGSYTTELLRVLVPAVILFTLLVLVLYYGWHKFFNLRKQINKDFNLMHDRVHRAFKLLSTETAKQLVLLEKSRKKSKLSSEEQQIVKEIKDSVDQIDLYIETQLKKIEDDDLS